MSMYNLLEYNDKYLKTSGSLWQYYRDEPAIDTNEVVTNFLVDNSNSASFKFKQKQQAKQAMTEQMMIK